jgi:hypothetical protein
MLLTPIMPLLGRYGRPAAGATLVLAVLALLPGSGCGGDIGQARSRVPPLPAYTPGDARLFDDGVEARALGFEIGDTTGIDDRLLPDRVEASDGVLRARVVTVTSKAEDSGMGLQLSLQPLETLAGRHAPDGDFTLFASAKSPALELMKAAEGRLAGLSFVVFVRSFADTAGNDGTLHFHLAPDDQAEQERVRAASVATFH